MENAENVGGRAEQIKACQEEFDKMYEEMFKRLNERFDPMIVDEVIRKFHKEYGQGE